MLELEIIVSDNRLFYDLYLHVINLDSTISFLRIEKIDACGIFIYFYLFRL